MATKRGNTVKKKGEPKDPAVYIERSGHDVVKKASELNVEEKASGGGKKRKADEEGPHVENEDGKEVKPGGKAANKAEAKEKEEANGTKKQKANTGEKKKAGRPKGTASSTGGAKKEKKPSKPRAEDTVSSRTRGNAK